MDIKDFILRNTTGNLFWKNKQGLYLGCNMEFARIARLNSPNEIIGKSDRDLFLLLLDEERVNKLREIDQYVIQNDKVFVTEEVGVNQAGEIAYYLTKKTPLKNEKNEVIGVMGNSIDITDRKKVEELKDKVYQQLQKMTFQQLKGMTLAAAAIAHELRTPLLAIKSAANGIEKIMPDLIQAYKIALSKGLTVPNISNAKLEVLTAVIPNLSNKVDHSNLIIDMLLANIGQLKKHQINCILKLMQG